MLPEVKRDTVRLGDLLSVAEQIQAFCMSRKTGEIYVTNAPPPARINLVEGEIRDAQFGLRSGLEAAIALINFRDPQTEFIVGERPPRHTIDMPYVQVLCEAARLKDETGAVPHRPTEPLRLTPSNPSLRVTVGKEIKTFPVRPGVATIGRSPESDIVIPDMTVSQQHASIEYSRNGVFLKDLGSTNGTYVAGQQVRERWLSVQDSVQFGGVHCLFIGGIKK